MRQLAAETRGVITGGEEEARTMHHAAVEPFHLILGMLQSDRGSAAEALISQGLSLDSARRVVARRRLTAGGPVPQSVDVVVAVAWSRAARRVLELAAQVASARGANEITPVHLLVAALQDPSETAAEDLEALGINKMALKERLKDD